MSNMHAHRTLPFLWALAVGIALTASLSAEDEQKDNKQEITVRGKVVCLDGSGQPLSSCEDVPQQFGLLSAEGQLYPFLPQDQRAQIFTDPQVRERELQISGLLREGGLEIVHLHSLRDGKLYDMYYRCEVCDITAYAPGPCWCCRREFEFRETPAASPR